MTFILEVHTNLVTYVWCNIFHMQRDIKVANVSFEYIFVHAWDNYTTFSMTLQGYGPYQWVMEVSQADRTFYFKHSLLLIFLHNSHGTKEIPDCRNLVRPDWVGNLRWDNREPYEPFRLVNMEPSMQFRMANTDTSVQFRKANTDPSMQFRWGHMEFLFC